MQNTAVKRRKWRKIFILGILQTLHQEQQYPPKRNAVGSTPIRQAGRQSLLSWSDWFFYAYTSHICLPHFAFATVYFLEMWQELVIFHNPLIAELILKYRCVRFQKIAYFIGVYTSGTGLSAFVPFSRSIFLRRRLNKKKRNGCNSFYWQKKNFFV